MLDRIYSDVRLRDILYVISRTLLSCYKNEIKYMRIHVHGEFAFTSAYNYAKVCTELGHDPCGTRNNDKLYTGAYTTEFNPSSLAQSFASANVHNPMPKGIHLSLIFFTFGRENEKKNMELCSLPPVSARWTANPPRSYAAACAEEENGSRGRGATN